MTTINENLQPASAQTVRESSVGWIIKSLSARFDKNMIETLKSHGITLSQFGILMTLLEQDGLTQSEIGKKILMPGYATTRNIDALENLGLLERQKNETCRRSFCIRLTPQGKSLGPVLFSTVKTVNEKALAKLSEEEVTLLKQLLHKIEI